MINTQNLILYREIPEDELFRDMTTLINGLEAGDNDEEARYGLFFKCVGRLVEMASAYGFSGNLWHCYLTYKLVNCENAFSRATEVRGAVEGSINELARHDFKIMKAIFDYDLGKLGEALDSGQAASITNYAGIPGDRILYNARIRDRICELAVTLANTPDVASFKAAMEEFYKDYGVGKLGLHKAFRIVHDKDDRPTVQPITNIAHVHLDDLVGYEPAKKKLLDNTEAFVNGRQANNCLLFGDAGTGKSTSVKALLNMYYDRGLRVIEVFKHQLQDINAIIDYVKNRNYKFILFMDDLSFEEFEIEYKYLKAVIEGDLEKKPQNVLIYATSNRRHLVREDYSDKAGMRNDNDMHTSDTVQEKLSLSARFGVKVYFSAPDKKEFNNIVLSLAKRAGITMPEDQLLLEANKWEVAHGGFSGRIAQQFIDYLLGQEA
ncbi:MAG: ATP-binding protein [Lachnospiraceae bacterium]|nr:ATP-binding protein [Lachnospiraceae bacterium]